MLWSLKREVFKQIQAVSASTIQMQRARWLINSQELAVLSAIDLSRLVGTLQGNSNVIISTNCKRYFSTIKKTDSYRKNVNLICVASLHRVLTALYFISRRNFL